MHREGLNDDFWSVLQPLATVLLNVTVDSASRRLRRHLALDRELQRSAA